jgi:hypothetical protein
VFDVQIVYRYTYLTDSYAFCEARFLFSVTYDPAHGFGFRGVYGCPTFSSVPLMLPARAADRPLQNRPS